MMSEAYQSTARSRIILVFSSIGPSPQISGPRPTGHCQNCPCNYKHLVQLSFLSLFLLVYFLTVCSPLCCTIMWMWLIFMPPPPPPPPPPGCRRHYVKVFHPYQKIICPSFAICPYAPDIVFFIPGPGIYKEYNVNVLIRFLRNLLTVKGHLNFC